MRTPPVLQAIRAARKSGHAAERAAPASCRVVFWLLLAVTGAGCAPAQLPMGSLYESSGAPIPLRAGYWMQQPEFRDARFTGDGLEDVSISDAMERGLVWLARSTFRGSAQFESQATALASPVIDVVVVPTIDHLAMEPDPDGLGPKKITTVRMQWSVTDKAGRVLWSNQVDTQLREACLVQLCRKELAERAVREHLEAAGAEMRSFPWWQRSR
ncbi:MAG TPA: hypothetical protein VMG58_11055 [Candidatus Sulfotelmatobacter sp.]|nr:hypothetical protein [Candidatus Sulfotelmatobacter sp.]